MVRCAVSTRPRDSIRRNVASTAAAVSVLIGSRPIHGKMLASSRRMILLECEAPSGVRSSRTTRVRCARRCPRRLGPHWPGLHGLRLDRCRHAAAHEPPPSSCVLWRVTRLGRRQGQAPFLSAESVLEALVGAAAWRDFQIHTLAIEQAVGLGAWYWRCELRWLSASSGGT